MIQINILAHNSDRLYFTEKSLEYLKNIKNENKSNVRIVISYSDNNQSNFWNDILKKFKDDGFKIELSHFPYSNGNNYMDKINSFIKTDCKYSCSMDDDIIISNELWDFMIENINILDNDDNLFLAPIISNGIPSVELFIEDFCDEEFKKNIYNLFCNTKIPNLWGANYEHLNVDSGNWDGSYFKRVEEINHYYKGIHPIRISTIGHEMLANYICNNYQRIISNNNYYLEKHNYPYFCNSFYFIKTDIWRRIINDSSLFRDPYDEVPLNLYMKNNNLNMIFVRNGFSLHMAYNTIGQYEQKRIEEIYKKNIIKK